MKRLYTNIKKNFFEIVMIIKNPEIPLINKVLGIVCSLLLFLPLLPFLLALFVLLFLLFILLVFLCMLLFFFFIFPFFLIISAICDILCAGKMKNYRDTKMLKYHLPVFIYYFPIFPVMLIFDLIRMYSEKYQYFNNDIIYLIVNTDIIIFFVMLIYVLIIYIGMYRRLKNIDDKKYLLETLEGHRAFLKLSFIPLSFLITILGTITIFSDVSIELKDLNNVFNILYGVTYVTNSSILSFILSFIVLFILLYIASIPIQLAALFINNTFTYFIVHGEPYVIVLKRLIKKINDFL